MHIATKSSTKWRKIGYVLVHDMVEHCDQLIDHLILVDLTKWH
jgi:hypothetical protein